MPIRTYRTVHTGPNTPSGGVHPGLSSVRYQPRMLPANRDADGAAGDDRRDDDRYVAPVDAERERRSGRRVGRGHGNPSDHARR